MTEDLASPRLILWKGFLFLFAGALAAACILILHPDWLVALLLGVSLWSFCRWYYFMFYVVEHYVDSTFKFAGLVSFLRYVIRRRIGGEGSGSEG